MNQEWSQENNYYYYYFAANEILFIPVYCSIAISIYTVHLLLQNTSGCHMKNLNVCVCVIKKYWSVKCSQSTNMKLVQKKKKGGK